MKYYKKKYFFTFLYSIHCIYSVYHFWVENSISIISTIIFLTITISWVLVLLSFCRKNSNRYSYPKFVKIFSLGFVLCSLFSYSFSVKAVLSLKACVCQALHLALETVMLCSLFSQLLSVKTVRCIYIFYSSSVLFVPRVRM